MGPNGAGRVADPLQPQRQVATAHAAARRRAASPTA
jgi:hypothetical protein